jgi:hypothetical protein
MSSLNIRFFVLFMALLFAFERVFYLIFGPVQDSIGGALFFALVAFLPPYILAGLLSGFPGPPIRRRKPDDSNQGTSKTL